MPISLRFPTILFLILSMLLIAAPAMATTYYLDSMDGDDHAAGTSPETALRTLDAVNRLTLVPGDRVLLRAGSVFDGQLKPSGRGSAEHPILIGMYGDGSLPRIDAHGKHIAALHLYNTEHITVERLHISNYGEERGEGRRGILIEIENFGTAHNITIRHNRITNVNGSLFKNKGGGTGIVFSNHGRDVKSRFQGLLIEHNHLVRTERNGITGSSGYADRSQWHPSLNVIIQHNLLEEIPGDGIVPIGCDGAIIRHNVIRNGTPLLRREHSAAAGIWPWASDNTLIEYNEVSHHRASQDGQGFDADWNCRGTIIQYNYSHHNDGGFLLICNDGKAGPDWSAGNTGTIIRHNVSFNDGLREVDEQTYGGMRAPAINVNGTVNGAHIHDNLIIAPAKASPRVDNKLVIATNWNGFPSGVLIERNTFITEGPAGFETGRGSGFVYRNNRLIGPIEPPSESPEGNAQIPAAEDPSVFKFPGPGVESGLQLLERHGMR